MLFISGKIELLLWHRFSAGVVQNVLVRKLNWSWEWSLEWNKKVNISLIFQHTDDMLLDLHGTNIHCFWGWQVCCSRHSQVWSTGVAPLQSTGCETLCWPSEVIMKCFCLWYQHQQSILIFIKMINFWFSSQLSIFNFHQNDQFQLFHHNFIKIPWLFSAS